ncbi:hypothetical protein CRUP_030077 [Coryphaenoides rupestris]|nr:hypothetical protein CRUP_030077 [Coryphaenoides rupestris]
MDLAGALQDRIGLRVWSRANENLFATTGFPGKISSQLLIHHLGHPQPVMIGSAASSLSSIHHHHHRRLAQEDTASFICSHSSKVRHVNRARLVPPTITTTMIMAVQESTEEEEEWLQPEPLPSLPNGVRVLADLAADLAAVCSGVRSRTHGSGECMGADAWRMYWVHWNTLKARLARKSRADSRPAAGRSWKPVFSARTRTVRTSSATRLSELTKRSRSELCTSHLRKTSRSTRGPLTLLFLAGRLSMWRSLASNV